MTVGNGSYSPGLMYIKPRNRWHTPTEARPGKGRFYSTRASSKANKGADHLSGISLCPSFFARPLFRDLGEPKSGGSGKQLGKYIASRDGCVLHELCHLVDLSTLHLLMFQTSPSRWVILAIKYQPPVYSPSGIKARPDSSNRNWGLGTEGSNGSAYGYEATAWLGPAKLQKALVNADNYAVLGTCLQSTILDCLGQF